MPGLTKDQIAYYQKDMYKAQLESTEKEPAVHPMVLKMEGSAEGHNEGLGDKETQMLGAGELKQHTAENEDIDFKTPVQGWTTYTAYQTFSDGMKFSKNAVDRTVSSKIQNMLRKLASTWGFSIVVEKETYASTAFNEGGALAGNAVFNGTSEDLTDSSGDLLYDGVPLFALSGNNHVPKGGGTGYYNSVPGITLTADNFQTVYNLHTATNNRDERNRIVRNPADTLLTTVGDDAIKAMEILKTQLRPDGQLNNINALSRLGVTHIAWDYLDDSNAFYVMKKQAPEIVFINAQEPEIRFSRDETNLAYQASVNTMFGLWFKAGAWKRITRGGGTSS